MIVLYNEPKLLYLPYIDKNKQQRERTFIPGKNTIDSEDWEAIVVFNKKRFEAYYNTKFKVLKPVKDIVAGMAIGENNVDVYKLTVIDLIDLINGTMEIDELRKYQEQENKGKKRKTVLAALGTQIKKIARFEQKIQSKSKG